MRNSLPNHHCRRNRKAEKLRYSLEYPHRNRSTGFRASRRILHVQTQDGHVQPHGETNRDCPTTILQSRLEDQCPTNRHVETESYGWTHEHGENQALHLIVPNKRLKSCIAEEGRDKPHCELSCFLRDLRILAYKFEHISHIYPQDGDGNRDDDERENGGVRLSSEFFVLLCAESLSAYGFQSAGHT